MVPFDGADFELAEFAASLAARSAAARAISARRAFWKNPSITSPIASPIAKYAKRRKKSDLFDGSGGIGCMVDGRRATLKLGSQPEPGRYSGFLGFFLDFRSGRTPGIPARPFFLSFPRRGVSNSDLRTFTGSSPPAFADSARSFFSFIT